MDYEKKYKEAFERARTLHGAAANGGYVIDAKNFETIFPELRESEDERIRKELLEHCINRSDGKQVCVDASDYKRWADWLFKIGNENTPNVKSDEVIRNEIIKFLELPHPQFVGRRHQEKWIAWLEKLKGCEVIKKEWFEHIKKSWYKEGYIDGKYSGAKEWKKSDATILNELIDFFENGKPKLQHDLTLYANWLKKQFTPLEKQGEKLQSKSALEAIKEEKVDNQNCVKTTNKVEPKFNVGDWIISNDKQSTYQVIEVKRGIYVLRDNVDNYEYQIGIEEAEKSGRLWGISDANVGDVLVASDGSIFLFAGVVDCACKYYVALTTDYYVEINKEAKGGYWETSRAVYPATKEQHDLLFTKMKEAGYEWDDEKKELKLLITNGGDFFEPENCEQKSSWSEGDDAYKLFAICAVEDYYCEENPLRKDIVDWLNSLKERSTH